MSNMKDYMMWLDNKGIATWDNTLGELIVPEGTIIWTYELKDQYDNDAKWHGVELDDDDCVINDDDELLDDDELGDLCYDTPISYWFAESGGLTANAYNFLYNAEQQGALI
tara:strand:- start:685 stop:1017 length:333 start_codon:yes stop_codon:yes gene_type:complete